MKHLMKARLVATVGIAVCAVGWPSAGHAQIAAMLPQSQFELAGSVELDRVDSTIRGHLEQIDAYLADRQWDEAIEAIRERMAASPDRLIGVTETRFIGLRDYLHLKLAGLPPEGLALYRSRVDPLAESWYEQGIARRDRASLRNVIDQAFVSSFGDDALLALGDMAVERADYAAARWHFERILPVEVPEGTPRTWPGYPDSDVDAAAVRARLVLVSILEGSLPRAREELEAFEELHGDAAGRLGGQDVVYREALGRLLAESVDWPTPPPTSDWPTFAGDFARNKTAPAAIDGGWIVWRIGLPQVAVEGRAADAPSFHPLFVDDLVLAGGPDEIKAVRLTSGKPPWGVLETILRAEGPGRSGGLLPATTLGSPCYTMTVHEGRLLARIGSPLTARPARRAAMTAAGSLVCLDLAAQGRLMWTVVPEEGWAIEGAPVAQGDQVYVAMRRSDVRPQAHVACFDARTGQRRWRRFVCGAETPSRGMLYEATHNLLTLVDQTLYLNTNLGAVASIDARGGRLLWVSLYPRAADVDLARPAPHWNRGLNPCVYHRGTLLVAPADSPRIFAFDAAGGQILWQTGEQVADVRHLLGATEEHLIASGDRLYWIGLSRTNPGRVEHVWPEGGALPGYGRGVLAGGNVLFPGRERIMALDQATAEPRKVIHLGPLGITGGNLLAAGDHLLIATKDELIALGPQTGKSEPPPVASVEWAWPTMTTE
jgi:outer membrane protein assembly factor BamB